MSIKTGSKCVVNGCNNILDANSELTFHRFPTHRPDLAEKWMKIVNRDEFIPSRTMVVCGDHFSEDSFQMRSGRKILKANTIPTIPPKMTTNEETDRPLSPTSRLFAAEHVETSLSVNEDVDAAGAESDPANENRIIETDAESTVFMIHSYAHLNDERDELKQKIDELEMQNKKLRDQLKLEKEKNVQLRKESQKGNLDVTPSDKKMKMSIAYIRF